MSVEVAGLRLPGPVLVASGCGGRGRELSPYLDWSRVGAFVTRTITSEPRLGRAGAVLETPSGLLHATGLPNPGLEQFLATELPPLVQLGVRVVVSIAGTDLRDHGFLARRIGQAPGVSAVEVNLAQPDAAALGLFEVREPFHAASVLQAVVRELPPGVPALAKIRPDLLRVVESARTVTEAGAGAVVVGHALPAALPDGRPAGLSGPAVAPLTLRCVTEVRDRLPEVQVVAAGGVVDTATARAYLDAGACAVQVGTALLHDPTTVARIAAGTGEDR